jgi:hypothetical protein
VLRPARIATLAAIVLFLAATAPAATATAAAAPTWTNTHGRRVVNIIDRGKAVAQVGVDTHWLVDGGVVTATRGFARLSILVPDGSICVGPGQAGCRPRGRIERVNHGAIVNGGPGPLLATTVIPSSTTGPGTSVRAETEPAVGTPNCSVVVTAAYVDIRLRDNRLLDNVRIASTPAQVGFGCPN